MSINPGAFEAVIPFAMGVMGTVVGLSKRYDTPKWTKMRRVRWLGPLLILFGIFTFIKDSSVSLTDLNDVASKIRKNAQLPRQIDEETTFSDVKPIDPTTLGFYFTLVHHDSVSPRIPEMMRSVESSLKAKACTDQNYLTFFKEGIALSIIYSGNDGQQVSKIDFKPADCGIK